MLPPLCTLSGCCQHVQPRQHHCGAVVLAAERGHARICAGRGHTRSSAVRDAAAAGHGAHEQGDRGPDWGPPRCSGEQVTRAALACSPRASLLWVATCMPSGLALTAWQCVRLHACCSNTVRGSACAGAGGWPVRCSKQLGQHYPHRTALHGQQCQQRVVHAVRLRPGRRGGLSRCAQRSKQALHPPACAFAGLA